MPPLPRSTAKLLRQLQSRHTRRKLPYFIAEGFRCCREATCHRPSWVRCIVLADHVAPPEWLPDDGPPVYVVSQQQLDDAAQTENPQGILVLLEAPAAPAEPPPPADRFVLVLDRIQTPGNVGTICRTAVAVGLHQVVCTAGTADPFAAKTVRAGMGAQFMLDFCRFSDLEATRHWAVEHGYPDLWLTVPTGGVSCFSPTWTPNGGLLVLGNEAHGTGAVPGASEVTIPMDSRAESLNVAQAATVLLYQATFGRGDSLD